MTVIPTIRRYRMNPEQLLERITVNPEVMVGKPTIRGLRITVEQILKALAGGVTIQDLLEDYPELEPEDIQAVLLYAAELVSEEQVFEVGINT
jgi:uncharacterized protein (DUF433 family)